MATDWRVSAQSEKSIFWGVRASQALPVCQSVYVAHLFRWKPTESEEGRLSTDWKAIACW